MNYIISASTDIGISKDTNQDSLSMKVINTSIGRMSFAVLCDGMGGLAKGEVASASVIRAFDTWVTESLPHLCSGPIDENIIRTQWEKILLEQNVMIKGYGARQGVRLGTTAVVLLLTEENYYIMNVGDSRAYIMRGNKIKQITKDHSLVQEMIESGELTPEEAKVHPNKNLITRALGISEDLKLDFIEAPVQSGDVLILTTDGLTNYVDERELVSVIGNGDVANACEHLVDMAKSAGGSDNITVTLIIV